MSEVSQRAIHHLRAQAGLMPMQQLAGKAKYISKYLPKGFNSKTQFTRLYCVFAGPDNSFIGLFEKFTRKCWLKLN